MEYAINLFEVMPNELNHSRKWVCLITDHKDNIWRRERIVSEYCDCNEDYIKKELLNEVLELFRENVKL